MQKRGEPIDFKGSNRPKRPFVLFKGLLTVDTYSALFKGCCVAYLNACLDKLSNDTHIAPMLKVKVKGPQTLKGTV